MLGTSALALFVYGPSFQVSGRVVPPVLKALAVTSHTKYGRRPSNERLPLSGLFFGGLLPLPCRSSGPPHERARPTTTQPRASTPLVWHFPRRAGPHRPTAYHSSRVSPRAEGGLSVPAVTAAEGGEQDARGLRDRRIARPLRLVAPAPLLALGSGCAEGAAPPTTHRTFGQLVAGC